MADRMKPPPKGRMIPARWSPKIVTLGTRARLWRIHNTDPAHLTTPTGFRHCGPLGRFDHQNPRRAGVRSRRGIMYVGLRKADVCFTEVFEDGSSIDRSRGDLSLLRPRRTLRLLSLVGSHAMQAGTVAGISGAPRMLSQAWSRYFYRILKEIDGIQYAAWSNGMISIALFERCAKGLEEISTVRLADSDLDLLILRIARDHRFTITP